MLGTVWNAWQEQWSGVVDTQFGETFTDFSTERGFGRGRIASKKQGNTNNENRFNEQVYTHLLLRILKKSH